jgi:hemoglobin-like flavoprotein
MGGVITSALAGLDDEVSGDEANEGEKDDNSKQTHTQTKTLLSAYLAPRRADLSEPMIDENSQALCIACWRDIEFFVGKETFCAKFFQIFDAVNPEVSDLFRPHKKKGNYYKFNSRWAMLMMVVGFFLKINSNSFAVKKKLRSVGRKHFISGVRREYVKAFNDVFLTALQTYLNYRELELYTPSWTNLLDFCLKEMYIEDIHLESHCM